MPAAQPNSQASNEMYRLSAAAELAGVTSQQLQYYLMVGLVDPSAMSDGNQRLFDDRAIKKIRMIRALNQGGYPLREIRDIFMVSSRPDRSS